MDRPTREQILGEPAGDRLDQWVSEFVLGIGQRLVRAAGTTEHFPVWTDNPFFSDGGPSRDLLLRYGAPPRYSTELAAAWVVLEWMQSLRPEGEQMDHSFDTPPWVCLERDRDTGAWCAGWKGGYDYEGESWGWYATGETAPVAICRAALLAVLDGEG